MFSLCDCERSDSERSDNSVSKNQSASKTGIDMFVEFAMSKQKQAPPSPDFVSRTLINSAPPSPDFVSRTLTNSAPPSPDFVGRTIQPITPFNNKIFNKIILEIEDLK